MEFANWVASLGDRYLLCGFYAHAAAMNAKGRSPASGPRNGKDVTLSSVVDHCAAVHGEEAMQKVGVAVAVLVGLATLVLVVKVYQATRTPERLRELAKKSDAKKKKRAEAAAVGGALPEAREAEGPGQPEEASTETTGADAKRWVDAAETVVGVATAAQPQMSGPLAASQILVCPKTTPLSAAAGSKLLVAAPKATAFPSRVGVLAASPCQQYLLVSCRSALAARVYPQNTKRAFMARGPELRQQHFLDLGLVLGPLLRLPARPLPTPDAAQSTTAAVAAGAASAGPLIDISCAAFLSSTPMAALASGGSDAAGVDPLLYDGSSSYVCVGESTRDVYVILRLDSTGKALDTRRGIALGLAGPCGASAAFGEVERAALLQHYSEGTQLRAQVLWAYKPPNHRLVWQRFTISLASSCTAAAGSGARVAPSSGRFLFNAAVFEAGGASDAPAGSGDATVADMLVFTNADDCSVEVVHRSHCGDGAGLLGVKSGAGDASGTAKSLLADADSLMHATVSKRAKNANRSNVGHAAAMAVCDPVVVSCGTFITDPRVTQITLHSVPPPPLTSPADAFTFFNTEKLFPAEMARMHAQTAHHGPNHAALASKGKHAAALASAPLAAAQGHLHIPRLGSAAFLASLAAAVGAATKHETSPPADQLLSAFAFGSSGAGHASHAAAKHAPQTRFRFPPTTVQRVALVQPFQPATRYAENISGGASIHRPYFCVVVLDNGCGYIYDLAANWATPGAAGTVSASGGGCTSDSVRVAYRHASGGRSTAGLERLSEVPMAHTPIGAFFDVSFARKEAGSAGGPATPLANSCLARCSDSSAVRAGGCDRLAVAVRAEPNCSSYGLVIALVNDATRRIAVFATDLKAEGDEEGSAPLVYSTAPATGAEADALGRQLLEGKPAAAVASAVAKSERPAAMLLPVVKQCHLVGCGHPNLNRCGERNEFSAFALIQNGLGVATMGGDDGVGLVMTTLPQR